MKVLVTQKNLTAGLNTVIRAVNQRTYLPILANILVAGDEGWLRLSATDMEKEITCWVEAEVIEDGAITVPAKTFTELAKTLASDQDVVLSLDEKTQTLRIACGTSKSKIKGIDAQEFPPIDATPEGGLLINALVFKNALKQTLFAASTDDARPVLAGVHIAVDGDILTMAGADGFRLSVKTVNLGSPALMPFNVIVPGKSLGELYKIITDDESLSITLPEKQRQIVFSLDNVRLTSQLVDGAFPDFQQIVPKTHNTRAVVAAKALLSACKQVAIFANDGAGIVTFDIAQGTIAVAASTAETGASNRVIECELEGQPILFTLNVKFVLDVLGAISDDTVVFETTAPSSPVVMRINDEVHDFLHIIMPMHLSE